MALLVLKTTDGESVLVHSSIFDDPPRIPWEHPADRVAGWQRMWARFDGEQHAQPQPD